MGREAVSGLTHEVLDAVLHKSTMHIQRIEALGFITDEHPLAPMLRCFLAQESSTFQSRLSRTRVGPLGKRCTSSSDSRCPSKRPTTARPLSAPRSNARKLAVCVIIPILMNKVSIYFKYNELTYLPLIPNSKTVLCFRSPFHSISIIVNTYPTSISVFIISDILIGPSR